MTFENIILNLESMGLADTLLPFLLIFTIVFAIMQKSKILGEKKNLNIMVALVLALLVVIPHVTNRYPPGADVVNIMNSALPNISLVLVAILGLLLVLGMFGLEMAEHISGLVGAVAMLVVIYIFGASAGWWGNWEWIVRFFGEDAITIAVIVFVFAALIWYIQRDESKSEGAVKGAENFFKNLFTKRP